MRPPCEIVVRYVFPTFIFRRYPFQRPACIVIEESSIIGFMVEREPFV